jgi:hypothetical protein
MPKKMDANVEQALVVASQKALTRARKKPVTFAVQRILKQNRFSPLSIFINQVFPNLEPKDQASSIFRLMEYIYPKVERADSATGKARKGSKIQVNTQVNVPQASPAIQAATAQQPQLTLQELLKIASGDNEQ